MVIDVGRPSGSVEDKEERPTKDISGFMEELVNLIKKKFEIQNSQIEILKTNLNMIKQNEIENLAKKFIELENKVKELEKKLEKQTKQTTNIDNKILDSLKRV